MKYKNRLLISPKNLIKEITSAIRAIIYEYFLHTDVDIKNSMNHLINARGVYFIFQIQRGRRLLEGGVNKREGGVYQKISLLYYFLNAARTVNFIKGHCHRKAKKRRSG